MARALLKNGDIYTGASGEPLRGDVLLEDGLIAQIGTLEPSAGTAVFDCSELSIAPGLIDAHSHSDLQTLAGRREKIAQGVTYEVVGNCGFSAFPCGGNRSQVQEFANGILCGSGDWGWDSVEDYLAAAGRSSETGISSLVGHGTLRIAVAGNRQGALTGAETDRMCGLLEEALSGGAAGLSTGLEYAPGESAPREELERLCGVVARSGKILTTHMRNYAGGLLASLDEQLELARHAGCRLQISHMQAVGAKNWHLQSQALERMQRAHDDGVDVAFDCYPYVAGSTVLTQWLPQWALAGGMDAMLARCANPPERQAIVSAIHASIPQEWNDLYVSAVRTDRNVALVGRSLEEIAAQRGCDPAELALDLLIEERGAVHILEFNQSEENLRALITHPLSTIVSDGFYVHGRPHPRLCGAFPRLLGEYCRRKKWLTLAEAVRKVTAAPASRFGVSRRGTLEPGFHADLVVFDREGIDSAATYEVSEVAPAGIRWVFRGGRLAFAGPARNGEAHG